MIGVLPPARLVCPWWARGVDAGCQEEPGNSGFEKLSKEKKEQGTAAKAGAERKEVQPFMSVEPSQKSVVLKPRHCWE